MLIRTIICQPSGFYVSPFEYPNASDAFRNRSYPYDDWRWIGDQGWYGTEENRHIWSWLVKYVDMNHWYDNEFEIVDVMIPEP